MFQAHSSTSFVGKIINFFKHLKHKFSRSKKKTGKQVCAYLFSWPIKYFEIDRLPIKIFLLFRLKWNKSFSTHMFNDCRCFSIRKALYTTMFRMISPGWNSQTIQIEKIHPYIRTLNLLEFHVVWVCCFNLLGRLTYK